MLTSGEAPITPKKRFFQAAQSMIIPRTAQRFQGIIQAQTSKAWDNTTKQLQAYPLSCVGFAGLPIHLWRLSSGQEAWTTVDTCPDGYMELFSVDLPNGYDYSYTVGDTVSYTLHRLAHRLSEIYPITGAHGIRYGAIWSILDPQLWLHDTFLVHFRGWL